MESLNIEKKNCTMEYKPLYKINSYLREEIIQKTFQKYIDKSYFCDFRNTSGWRGNSKSLSGIKLL